jgi:parallel beta-helix repeat protein
MVFAALWKLFQSPARRAVRRSTVSLRLEGLEGRWVPATITVNPSQSIQAAVNAASPGDTIQLADGTYTQTVTVSRNNANVLLNNLHFQGQHPGMAILTPPASIGSTDAVLDLNGVTSVQIQNLVVDGNAQVFDAGIRVRGGGSATIQQTTIRNTYNNGTGILGYGIRVGDNGDVLGSLTPGTAKIQNSTITNYNKGGIIVDGQGSSATIQNNTITGSTTDPNGLTTVSQIGVQVSNGASGRVQNNTITHNYFDFTSTIVALGVEIFNTTAATVVNNNNLPANESGIEVKQSSNVQVLNNDVDNGAFDGIILTQATNNLVKNNEVNGAGGDGITVQSSSNNDIENNEAECGSGSGLFVGTFVVGVNSNNNTIKNNHFEGNAMDGITLENASYNTLLNNKTEQNGQNGVADYYGSHNTITQDQSVANIADGVTLVGTSYDTLNQDHIDSNGGFGISLHNALNTTINKCNVSDNDLGSLYIDSASAPSTVLTGNHFDDDGTMFQSANVGSCVDSTDVQNSSAAADAATANL